MQHPVRPFEFDGAPQGFGDGNALTNNGGLSFISSNATAQTQGSVLNVEGAPTLVPEKKPLVVLPPPVSDAKRDMDEAGDRKVADLEQRIKSLERLLQVKHDYIGRRDPFPLVFPAVERSNTNGGGYFTETNSYIGTQVARWPFLENGVYPPGRGDPTSRVRTLLPPESLVLESPEGITSREDQYFRVSDMDVMVSLAATNTGSTGVGGTNMCGGVYLGFIHNEMVGVVDPTSSTDIDAHWSYGLNNTETINSRKSRPAFIINSEEFGLPTHRLISERTIGVQPQFYNGRCIGTTTVPIQIDGGSFSTDLGQSNGAAVIIINGGAGRKANPVSLATTETWARDNADAATNRGDCPVSFTVVTSLSLSASENALELLWAYSGRSVTFDANGELVSVGAEQQIYGGSIVLAGEGTLSVESLSGAANITADVTETTGTFTATLPDPTANTGKQYIVKNVSGALTLDTAGGTIDSGTNTTLSAGDAAMVVSNGTNWIIV